MMELIQLKLTSGEEVIAEVMEYPDEMMPEYVVRHAFSVRSMMNEDFTMSYGLSPWMMLQEKSTDMILVDPSSIISIAKPTDFMLREYNQALSYTIVAYKERVKKKEAYDAEFLKQLEKYTSNYTEQVLSDSSSNNIINFPDKDTLH